jgi:hypothetical protein
MKPGTSLKAFDSQLTPYGLRVLPTGPQNFTKGPVRCTVSGSRTPQTYSVSVTETHNPALSGCYADPANYLVRYGTSATPLGKITVPANNLVVSKDPTTGIYGTGHNSTIQVPGRDEWYLVYHCFTYPAGITIGRAAGFHREVCLDKLEFNADGSIKSVVPTHAGIQPVKLK